MVLAMAVATVLVFVVLAITSPVVAHLEGEVTPGGRSVCVTVWALYGLVRWRLPHGGAHGKNRRFARKDLLSVRRGFNYLFGSRTKVQLRDVRLSVQVGLEDAALTALACGAVWGLAGGVCSALSAWVRLPGQPPAIRVLPRYDRLVLAAAGSCILRTRLGHLMTAAVIGIWVLARARRVPT